MKILSIYSYFYLLFKRLYIKQHLKIKHNDIVCPNCQEWFSISGIEYKHTLKHTGETDLCMCGKCGSTSEWLCMAGLFVEVNKSKDRI